MTALVPNCLKSILVSLLVATVATPSSAQSPCDADLDHDGIVAGADLAIVLGDWGVCKGCQGDVTKNGVVDGIDLAFVLTLWGDACDSLSVSVIEQSPDPAIVINADLRLRILATGLPWRVRHDRTGIEMLLVPPGTFDMGCIQGSNIYGCHSWEQPVHSVTLTNAYYIGRYEVTQAQWLAKMGANPSAYQGPSRPVEHVSWDMIQEFLTGTGMRLPTEAEWEYACRAGTTTPFHSGPGFPSGTTNDSLLSQIAWWEGNYSTNAATRPVGGKSPNALGLHDMLGNVWEWCNDYSDYYSAAAQTNPTGPVSGSFRTLRGGDWLDDSDMVRSSYREGLLPFATMGSIGFRVARNP